MSGFAPPPKFRLTPEGQAAVAALGRAGQQINDSLERVFEPFRPLGVRAMQRALDSAPTEPAEPEVDLRDSIVDALREWRWYKHGELYRGESPYSVRNGDVRLATLIELIDEHDVAMGVPEPKRSLVKRGRELLEKFDRDGLSEAESEKILAWLGEEQGS